MKNILTTIALILMVFVVSACTQAPAPSQSAATTAPETNQMQEAERSEAKAIKPTATPNLTEADIPPVDSSLDAQTQRDLKDLDAMMNKVDTSAYSQDTLSELE